MIGGFYDRRTKTIHFTTFRPFEKALKDEGLCFAFLIDKADFDKSSLAIADAQSIRNGKVDGMKISLEKLNEGLI